METIIQSATGQVLWLVLLSVAVILNGLFAGASLDQSIEQLPSRHRIGMRAYSAYSRASHVANGRFWLIPLGLSGPVLTLAAALWSLTFNLPAERSFPVFLAAGLGVAHVLSTVKAASVNLTQWKERVADNEVALAEILQRFARWQALRASLQFLTFVVTIWALAVNGAAAAS